MALKPKKILFDKLGLTMTVTMGGGSLSYFKAFLQPLRYKNKIYLSGVPTELGYDGLQKYLLIALPDAPLELIDGNSYALSYEGYNYKVDHCEKVYHGTTPYYYWAIVSKEA